MPPKKNGARGVSIRFASSGTDRNRSTSDAPNVPIGDTYHRPSDSTTEMLGNSVGKPDAKNNEKIAPPTSSRGATDSATTVDLGRGARLRGPCTDPREQSRRRRGR